MTECVRCGTRGLYTRPYSGETLCRECFGLSIVDKARRTINKWGMIHRGERVAVAVSGGKDSLALLNSLSQLKDRNGWELVAITIDEGVKGYRDEAISNSNLVCSTLGVDQIVLSYKDLFGFSLDEALDWKDDREPSSCGFCGVFRRRAIDQAAEKSGADVVATAHNLDDFVQTFMLNLLHGDVTRLGWLSPSHVGEGFRLKRVKPFMEVYEQEVALYASLSGLPFQSTSCPYMHEGLRSEVRDQLNKLEAGHPGMKNVLLSSSLDVISRYERDEAKRSRACTVCGKTTSQEVCAVCRMQALVRHHINYTD